MSIEIAPMGITEYSLKHGDFFVKKDSLLA